MLLACDLREWDQTLSVLKSVLDASKPTFFLSECCLIYIDPVISDTIIKSCSTLTERGMFVTFEQVRPCTSV
jgi:O-methyltransferase involved in polyketide biosynthesis